MGYFSELAAMQQEQDDGWLAYHPTSTAAWPSASGFAPRSRPTSRPKNSPRCAMSAGWKPSSTMKHNSTEKD